MLGLSVPRRVNIATLRNFSLPAPIEVTTFPLPSRRRGMSVLLSVRATPVAHPLILEWVIRRLSEAQPQARRDRGGLPWDAAWLMTPASEPIKPVPWSVLPG